MKRLIWIALSLTMMASPAMGAVGAYVSSITNGQRIGITFADPSSWTAPYTFDWSKAPVLVCSGGARGNRTITANAFLTASGSGAVTFYFSIDDWIASDDVVSVGVAAGFITDDSSNTSGEVDSESATNTGSPGATTETLTRYVGDTPKGAADGSSAANQTDNLYGMCNEGQFGDTINIYVDPSEDFTFGSATYYLSVYAAFRTINIMPDPAVATEGQKATLATQFRTNGSGTTRLLGTTINFTDITFANDTAEGLTLEDDWVNFTFTRCHFAYASSGGTNSADLIDSTAWSDLQTLRNVTFTDCTYSTEDGSGAVMSLRDANVTIEDQEITAARGGILSVGRGASTIIRNNTVTAIDGAGTGVLIAVGVDGTSNSAAHTDNTIEVYGNTAHYPLGVSRSHAFLMGAGTDGAMLVNNIARNGDTNFVIKMTAGVTVSGNTSVIDETLDGVGILLKESGTTGCLVEFNTSIANGSSSAYACVAFDNGASDNIIRNNILVAGNGAICFHDVDDAGISGHRFYSNVLYLRDGSTVYASIGGVDYTDMDELNAALGIPSGSPYENVAGDPLFVDEAALNFAVPVSSPAYKSAWPDASRSIGAAQPTTSGGGLFTISDLLWR